MPGRVGKAWTVMDDDDDIVVSTTAKLVTGNIPRTRDPTLKEEWGEDAPIRTTVPYPTAHMESPGWRAR